jgi:hypothetical protein
MIAGVVIRIAHSRPPRKPLMPVTTKKKSPTTTPAAGTVARAIRCGNVSRTLANSPCTTVPSSAAERTMPSGADLIITAVVAWLQ